MNKEELKEVLQEYADANSEAQLVEFLKDQLVEQIEKWEVSTERQKHNLNLLIRDIEEELDYIESEKLSEFDPEQNWQSDKENRFFFLAGGSAAIKRSTEE